MKFPTVVVPNLESPKSKLAIRSPDFMSTGWKARIGNRFEDNFWGCDWGHMGVNQTNFYCTFYLHQSIYAY